MINDRQYSLCSVPRLCAAGQRLGDCCDPLLPASLKVVAPASLGSSRGTMCNTAHVPRLGWGAMRRREGAMQQVLGGLHLRSHDMRAERQLE